MACNGSPNSLPAPVRVPLIARFVPSSRDRLTKRSLVGDSSLSETCRDST